MELIVTIKLSEAIGNQLVSREQADELFLLISKLKSNTIVLDFSEIEFVSRSFADQLFKQKEDFFENSSCVFVFEHISSSIEKMLNTVKTSRSNSQSRRKFKEPDTYKFDEYANLISFISDF